MVNDVSVGADGQRGNQTEVEIVAKPFITDDTYREAHVPPIAERFDASDSIGVILRIAGTIVLRKLSCRTVNALIVILEGNIVGHIVHAQQKSEMVGRVVIILQVDHLPGLGLQVWNARQRKDKQKYYGENSFHDADFRPYNVILSLFIVDWQAFFD